MSSPSSTISDLRKSYLEWRPTQRFVEWARQIDPTPDETPTADLTEQLRLKAAEAKELFDGIDSLELASFIVGRRSHPSRLQWRYTLPSIAAVAMGEVDEFEPVGRGSLPKREPANQLIEYVFQLRRDLKIKLSLPADFSEADIVRLTAFLQTLPLSSEN